MPKASATRAPRGTNIVYKVLTDALEGFPEESRKSIATAVWSKIKTDLSSYRTSSASGTRGTATRSTRKVTRRGRKAGSRITKTSETANSIAA